MTVNLQSAMLLVIKWMLLLYCLTLLDVSNFGSWAHLFWYSRLCYLRRLYWWMDKEMVRDFNSLTVSSWASDWFGLFVHLFALRFQYGAEGSFIRHLVFLKYSDISQKLWSRSCFTFKEIPNHLFIN